MAQIKDFDGIDFLRIESLVTNSGYRGDRISWNKICAYIKEARATVRAERPVQQRKGKIVRCSQCDIRIGCKIGGRTNFDGCGYGRKTSPVA